MSRSLWMVRHGNRRDFVEPAWVLTAPRPYDPPLSDDGRVQAQEAAAYLAGIAAPRHLLASPMIRALETAAPFARALNLRIKVEHGLTELLYPEWFPDPVSYVPAAEHLPQDLVDPGYRPCVEPVQPEDNASALARCGRVAMSLLDTLDGDLLFVAHGGAIAKIAQSLLDGSGHVSTHLCGIIQLVEKTPGKWHVVRDGRDLSYMTAPDPTLRLH